MTDNNTLVAIIQSLNNKIDILINKQKHSDQKINLLIHKVNSTRSTLYNDINQLKESAEKINETNNKMDVLIAGQKVSDERMIEYDEKVKVCDVKLDILCSEAHTLEFEVDKLLEICNNEIFNDYVYRKLNYICKNMREKKEVSSNYT